MGCEYNVAEPCVSDGDGSVYGLSYPVNRENNTFVPLQDLGDSESVSSWEVESWERRLGIQIPKPPADNS